MCSTLKGGCYATLQPQCRSNCYANATLRYSATDKDTWESIGSAALRVIERRYQACNDNHKDHPIVVT